MGSEPIPKRARYYVLIVFVLLLGYVAGGTLAFGVQFAGIFPAITSETGRLVLTLYGMGVLGATLYCSRWWAIDLSSSAEDETNLPNAYDAFGYATTIVGGGVTGVVFFLVLRTGIGAAATNDDLEFRLATAVVLAFIGGLFHFDVQKYLAEVFKKVSQHDAGDEEDEEGGESETEEEPKEKPQPKPVSNPGQPKVV